MRVFNIRAALHMSRILDHISFSLPLLRRTSRPSTTIPKSAATKHHTCTKDSRAAEVFAITSATYRPLRPPIPKWLQSLALSHSSSEYHQPQTHDRAFLDLYLSSDLAAGDHIITLVVGSDGSQPRLKVPGSILRNISPSIAADVASAIGRKRHSSDLKALELQYTMDDREAWILLLYWAYHHRLPEPPGEYDSWVDNCDDLVSAWLLGNKYDIPSFQDLVMIELLQINECLDHHYIETAFTTTKSGSPIRRVLVEKIVYLYVRGELKHDYLDGLGRIIGFTSAFAKAMEAHRKEGEGMFKRMPWQRNDQGDRWIEYMLEKEEKREWKWASRAGEDGEEMRFLR